MFDNNIAIKILLAFGATASCTLLMFGVRRRSIPGADKWSTERFGVWWIGRVLPILATLVAGVGFAFGGKGSSAGAFILFCFSAAGLVVEFFRGKM
jgi:hypothetical protein